VIATRRLLLRPFVLADVPKLFAMSVEEGMRRWIPDQVYRDERHAEEVARALIALTEREPEPAARPYVLGVERHETGALIGHVGLSPARGSVEIGYAIEQRLHGQGFASEAVKAMADWALAELGLPEVLGVVAADNASSCRVLEKAGFARIAEETARLIYRRTRAEMLQRRVALAEQEAVLAAVWERLCDRQDQVGFEKLSRPAQVLAAIWMLQCEVDNGGFPQWMFNSYGDHAELAVTGLRELGAVKAADVCECFFALLGGLPAGDRDAREEKMHAVADAIGEGAFEQATRPLEEAFYALEDDLRERLYRFVLSPEFTL
jgi:RimJ/RimL family protein N-acetyltransferase